MFKNWMLFVHSMVFMIRYLRIMIDAQGKLLFFLLWSFEMNSILLL